MTKSFSAGAIALALGVCASAMPARAATEKVLYDFCIDEACASGMHPAGAITRDSAGNLYIVAQGNSGSNPINAAIDKFTPNGHGGWSAKVLYSFPFDDPPSAGVIIDNDGNLYGATNKHAYELSPGSGGKYTFKALVDLCPDFNICLVGFNGIVGRFAYQGSAEGRPYDGTSPLYAVSDGGGTFSDGTLIQLVQSGGTWSASMLHDFCNDQICSDGKVPSSELIVGANGVLTGTTAQGGGTGCDNSWGCGIVFAFAPPKRPSKPWVETVLHKFCQKAFCRDGATPYGSLAPDADGNFYGATTGGGTARLGTLYKLVPNRTHSKVTVLHSFAGQEGQGPRGVTLDAAGALYGIAGGGANNMGVAYRFAAGAFTKLYDFCARDTCVDGMQPNGPVMLDDAGNLFGVTYSGGKTWGGALYEITP